AVAPTARPIASLDSARTEPFVHGQQHLWPLDCGTAILIHSPGRRRCRGSSIACKTCGGFVGSTCSAHREPAAHVPVDGGKPPIRSTTQGRGGCERAKRNVMARRRERSAEHGYRPRLSRRRHRAGSADPSRRELPAPAQLRGPLLV